ncbi:MAG TPA: HNH/ENDO VII family nuclease [Pseudobdellovibrionaceae bacterium]|nr:HNH/ENDO VII family nuclease [Pseudobdellovibrionaceae bacterium]
MKYAFIWIFALLLTGCATIKPIEDASLPNADFSQLVRVNPVPQTQLLVQDKKFAEANDYLSYFKEYEYMKEDAEAIRLSQFIQETRESWIYKLKKMNSGFWTGESDETEGQVASVVSDFLVIGDLRDLVIEGNNLIQEKDVDKVNTSLATVGVVSSVAVVTASAKPAITFLKMTHKAGKMPKWLGKTLVESAEIAKKTNSLDHLKDIFSNVHGLYKTAGARTTLELLAKSKDINDFRRLAKFGKVFGNKTPTLLKVGGDDAITAFQRLGGAEKDTILEASTYGNEGVKFLEKNGAEIFKSGLSSTRRRMTNLEIQFVESGRKEKIGGKEFIKRDVIFNPSYIDGMQRSNIDRMKLGLAPIGKDGNPVNLHHMKQYNDGLICELSQGEHNEYSDILHRYLGRSESEIDRSKFNRIKSDYWKRRVYDFE